MPEENKVLAENKEGIENAKKLQKVVKDQFLPKNIKAVDYEEIRYPDGKIKVTKNTTYKNGVVKGSLVGIEKNGKAIVDKGLKEYRAKKAKEKEKGKK